MVSPPRVNHRLSDKIIEEDDVLRLIRMEPDPRNNLLLHLLYASGCRVSEVTGLKTSDCKPRGPRGQITVIGKGSRERTVMLTKSVWRKIEPLLEQPGDHFLFPSKKGGHITRRHVLHIVKAAARRAGLNHNISPHYLRHSHASHALDNGANPNLVREGLGHASLDTTTRYLHSRKNEGSADYLSD